ncbi:Dynein light chain roadblock-type 1 [Strongyloides ratti]|uniref:Dynein light chain roadblock-type 1 n=1 Tax=Strongyloides ratti TaxID=34506 RepID=A0A090MX27_STRRB|nr:Dynein light chain roadblock-type 1 [Strongyloides ratti]CEF64704.1 Dynein light chain roadblock-type 1 [Strongyloides ratti]
MAEVEEMFKKLIAQTGVTGVTVMDAQGRTIKSTLDEATATKHSNLLQQLCEKTRIIVKGMNENNDLNFMRVYTNTEEFLIAPQKEYTMIVIRDLDSQQTNELMEQSKSSLLINIDDDEENKETLDEINKASSLINVSSIGDEKKTKGWFFPLLSKRHTSPDPQSTSTKSLTKNVSGTQVPPSTISPISSPTSGNHSPFNIFQKLNIFSKPSNVPTTLPLSTDLLNNNDDSDYNQKEKISTEENEEEILRSNNIDETFSSPKIERWYDLKTLSPIQFNLEDSNPMEFDFFSNRSMVESKLLDELITDFRENKLKAFSQENLEQLRSMHKQQLEISALHAKLSKEEALNSFKDVDKLDHEFDILSQKLEELHKTMENFSPGISILS